MIYTREGVDELLALIGDSGTTEKVETGDSGPLISLHESFLATSFATFEDVLDHLKQMWGCYDAEGDVPAGNEDEYFAITRSYMELLVENDQEIDEWPSTLGYVDYYY